MIHVIKISIIILIAYFLSFGNLLAQQIFKDATLSKEVIAESQFFWEAKKSGNAEVEASYMHPTQISEKEGGLKTLVAKNRSNYLEHHDNGYILSRVDQTAPTEFYRSDNSIQCVFKLTLHFEDHTDFPKETSRVYIGIKENDRWYFLDTRTEPIEDIKRHFSFVDQRLDLDKVRLKGE